MLFETKFKPFLKLDIQYFAEPADNPDGGGDNPEPPTPPEQQEEKTFTQEDLNKLIAKEKKSAQESFLKSVGFEDFKNAKDGIEKFKEWQDSQKTDAEKQAAALEEAKNNLANLNGEKETLAAQLAALKAGANPDALDDLIVLAKTKVSDDVTIDDAIKQVLETYPQFKAQQEQQEEEKPPAPSFSGGTHTPPWGNTMTREEFSKKSYADRVEFQSKFPEQFKKLFEK